MPRLSSRQSPTRASRGWNAPRLPSIPWRGGEETPRWGAVRQAGYLAHNTRNMPKCNGGDLARDKGHVGLPPLARLTKEAAVRSK